MAWTHFLYYWPFVRGIYRSPTDSHDKGILLRSSDAFNLMPAWNKLLNKPSRGLWFEAPWHSCDVIVITIMWQCRIHLITLISCYPLIWWERCITGKPWDDGETWSLRWRNMLTGLKIPRVLILTQSKNWCVYTSLINWLIQWLTCRR